MTKREQIRRELELIASQNGGVLNPAEVVRFARDEKTALHSQFTWDDDKAAEAWRLIQASKVIRMCVVIEENQTVEHRVFVSLTQDRTKDGGYRPMTDVMSDDVMRTQLLAQAREELAIFSRKYRRLSELATVFAAIDKAIDQSQVESA